jgi:hypothetical protein
MVRVEGLLGRRQGNMAVARRSGRRALALPRDAAPVMIEVVVVDRPPARRLLHHSVVHIFLETGAGPV